MGKGKENVQQEDCAGSGLGTWLIWEGQSQL